MWLFLSMTKLRIDVGANSKNGNKKMKRNKPTSHSSPKMKPYGRFKGGAWADPREVDKGSHRMNLKKEIDELINDETDISND